MKLFDIAYAYFLVPCKSQMQVNNIEKEKLGKRINVGANVFGLSYECECNILKWRLMWSQPSSKKR